MDIVICIDLSWSVLGECGFNGEGCTLVEFTLKNPDPDLYGSGSSADISLIDPYVYHRRLEFLPPVLSPSIQPYFLGPLRILVWA